MKTFDPEEFIKIKLSVRARFDINSSARAERIGNVVRFVRETILDVPDMFCDFRSNIEGEILVKRMGGMIIPCYYIPHEYLARFPEETPTCVLNLEEGSNLPYLNHLREFWEKKDDRLYGNGDIAPEVEREGEKSLDGYLFIGQTGLFFPTNTWFLRNTRWSESEKVFLPGQRRSFFLRFRISRFAHVPDPLPA